MLPFSCHPSPQAEDLLFVLRFCFRTSLCFCFLAGGPHLTKPPQRVPHLRDGFIVDKVGHFRGSENPILLDRDIT
jgi:hypothetical protein